MCHTHTNHLFDNTVTVHGLTITVCELNEMWRVFEKQAIVLSMIAKQKNITESSTFKCILYTNIFFVVETAYRKTQVQFTDWDSKHRPCNEAIDHVIMPLANAKCECQKK